MLTVIMAALALPAAVWAQGTGDAALLQMAQAQQRNNSAQLTALLPRVQGHVLEPMAVYWEISERLDRASATEIRAALARLAGSFWEDRLRSDWLLQLGRQRDWHDFDAEFPLLRSNGDRQLQCFALLRDALQRRAPLSELAERVRERWLGQSAADAGCSSAAQTLLASGHLPPSVAWQRARLAIETRRPRVATQAVALLNPEWATIVSAIAADPAAYLNEKITAIRPRTKELVTLALIGLANDDPAAAARELNRTRWQAQLSQEERSWAWGVVGKRAAQRLQDDALTHFAQGQLRFMHDDHLAWKARAGLRAGAWDRVRDAIAAMSPAQQQEPVWVFWRARAIEELPATDALAAKLQARGLFASIAAPNGFYPQLALEELGRRIELPPAPAPLSAQERQTAQQHPGLQRALAAFRLGLRSDGVREWNHSIGLNRPIGVMSERELLAAAQLACQHELWDRCINTSERTVLEQDFAQRFPMPHRREVVQRSNEIGLDPAYVYGLIRQESRFVMDARSHVGAAGLMQVMPATARWTARKIGLNHFEPHHITERDTNILIGTAYLQFALDNFDGSMPLAAAAYNAGASRPRAWRNGPLLPAEIWIENIPFEETRDYVQKVLANTTIYAAILSGQPQSLRERLGVVGPRTETAAATQRTRP